MGRKSIEEIAHLKKSGNILNGLRKSRRKAARNEELTIGLLALGFEKFAHSRFCNAS